MATNNNNKNNSNNNNNLENINLSIHKIFNCRHSVPNKFYEDEKENIRKRRCTVAHMYEKNVNSKNINYDSLTYNFNNSIRKRRKYSPNISTHLYKKYSPLKSRIGLRNSVDESIKKSACIRSIVNNTIKNKTRDSSYIPNEKKSCYIGDKNNKIIYEACKYNEKNNYIDENINDRKMYINKNLHDTYIMSNTTQSDNFFRSKNINRINSLITNRETAPIYMNSESTLSSFNFEPNVEQKQSKLTLDMKSTIYIPSDMSLFNKNKYSFISNMSQEDIKKMNNEYTSKNNYNVDINNKINEHLPLKRRHSTHVSGEYDKYNNSQSYLMNKRLKEGQHISKNNIRRYSDTLELNMLNNNIAPNEKNNEYISKKDEDHYIVNSNNYNKYNNNNNNMNNMNNSTVLYEYDKRNLPHLKQNDNQLNKSVASHYEENNHPLLHTCFFKNAEDFENNDIKRKEKVESKEEDEFVMKKDAEYVFSQKFFQDIYSNIKSKGELNFIDELLQLDEENYISKSKLNKIVENAKNKEMKYHYIDRMFLYRHAKNVIDDADYEKYKNKCRSEYKYLDVPFPNLCDIMNLKRISNDDEIDDTDEFYDAEVALLEEYYSRCNKQKLQKGNNIFLDNKKQKTKLEKQKDKKGKEKMKKNQQELNEDHNNKIILKNNQINFNKNDITEDLSILEKRDKLMLFMNKMKRQKDSFYESIIDAPDFSKLLEPVFSLNESFLLSHQLFNVQYAAQLGPVVYLTKTEDENYIYRAIEVSRLFEEKVKSILDNQKNHSGMKNKSDSYDCFTNEKNPFLHELDVKYYLRIPMSTGWNHFGYLKNQNNVLFFRRPKNN
ncbi:conserved Plasmodium protein, unknown function [Plasmodium sp. gorilla clade G2]|uniref:conserved Plasmodium protein, unknown function n=1 Tax=Plasmodium sp. gorilla clade G2 TaxID=880535 RepID=UPI000D212B8D|nr:conserved Plasmodium protein, unknown function [Plasmodium sp. gorilla clade G2]SOV10212.1 conserved Plasmodium protein, unknown function [Plasmodium sp. gorilla clade G2]